MKTRQRKLTNLLMIAVLLLVTVLSSCSDSSSAPVLCTIKLDSEEATRDFKVTLPLTSISNYNIYYKAVYLGNGSSYGSKTDFVEYDNTNGILLSQGKWRIDCEFRSNDTNATLLAQGTTGEIFVNLNTTSFRVYVGGSSDKGSVSLTYDVKRSSSSSVSSVSVKVTLQKYNGSSFEEVTIDNPTENSVSGITIKSISASIGNLDAGRYLLKLETRDSNNGLLFTDSLGFIVRAGQTTEIQGVCYVKEGTTGTSEYIPWEPIPTEPEGNVVEVGGGTQTNTSDNRSELNSTVIQDETIYSVYPTENKEYMELGHSSDGNRILTPVPGTNGKNDFAIDLKGVNVVVTKENTGLSGWNENTTIVQLNQNISMCLYNSSSTAASWGLSSSDSLTRKDANVILNGGTLNIIGKGDSEDISDGHIDFIGPTESLFTFLVRKYGAINVTGPGGNIVVDGSVTIKSPVGISSYNSDGSTALGSSAAISIDMKGSQIESSSGAIFGSEKLYGIYLIGNNSSNQTIDIVLDGATITTAANGAASSCGIKLENFGGPINIILKNGAMIDSKTGYGIYLNNCTGAVSISVENGCTVSGGTNPLYTNNVPNLKTSGI